MSPLNAQKLRTVGKNWFRYKKLKHLSIFFDEFYRQKDEIIFLMQNYPGIVSAQKDINDNFDLDDYGLERLNFNFNCLLPFYCDEPFNVSVSASQIAHKKHKEKGIVLFDSGLIGSFTYHLHEKTFI